MENLQHTSRFKKLIYYLLNTIIPLSIGKIVNLIFFKYSNVYIHPSVRIKGEGDLYVGRNVVVDANVTFHLPLNSKIVLADNTRIGEFCYIEPDENCTIKIGNYSSLQTRSQIRGEVIIGDNTLIAPNCFISSGKHIYNKFINLTIREQDILFKKIHKASFSKPIMIGSDCWIGINTVILPGANISDGCVIGANIVVYGFIEKYTVLSINQNLKKTARYY